MPPLAYSELNISGDDENALSDSEMEHIENGSEPDKEPLTGKDPSPKKVDTQKKTHKFRGDIQGLRSVAVLCVFLYHLQPNWLPGGYVGVDVFFVISGYLITGVLFRELKKTGTVSLENFYSRRIKRLLPAATIVLVFVGLTSSLLPATAAKNVSSDVFACALYYQNWNLARQAVDYLALDDVPGPLQHFWSLSVEEQYYIVWPILIMAAMSIFPKDLKSMSTFDHKRLLIFTLLIAVAIPSLCLSIFANSYFPTTNRAWELAAGGLLACIPFSFQIPFIVGSVLSSCGVAMIVCSWFLFSSATMFPGYAALLPIIGTCLILISGENGSDNLIAKVLSLNFSQYIGDISYSLYLWHWPVIIYYKAIAETELRIVDMLICVTISFSFAHISKYFIEDAFRSKEQSKWSWHPFMLGIFCIAASLAVASVPLLSSIEMNHFKRNNSINPGIISYNGTTNSTLPLNTTQPHQIEWKTLVPMLTPDKYSFKREKHYRDKKERCYHLTAQVRGPKDAKTRVAIVGDSHAEMWYHPIRKIAEERGWKTYFMLKYGCAWTATMLYRKGKLNHSCNKWGKNVINSLEKMKVDYVIQAGLTKNRAQGATLEESPRYYAEGLLKYWKRLEKVGTKILAIQETPSMKHHVPNCVFSPKSTREKCSQLRENALAHPDPQVFVQGVMPRSSEMIDFSDILCDKTWCGPVDGKFLMYKDTHHLTHQYTLSLKDVMEKKLLDAMKKLK